MFPGVAGRDKRARFPQPLESFDSVPRIMQLKPLQMFDSIEHASASGKARAIPLFNSFSCSRDVNKLRF